jgi:flagellar basal body-associated protein FliL
MKAAATLLAVLVCSAMLLVRAPRAEEAPVVPAGPVFVPVDPLVVPVFHAGDVRLHLIYVVQLEAGDAAASARIREMMPRLRDAYLRALAGIADRVGSGAAPDIERVKRSLAAASERVLGPRVVNGVLIERSFSRRAS